MSYGYGSRSAPFVHKFVHHSKFAPPSRYEPYAPSPYASTKIFSFQYTLPAPSQMRLEVTHQQENPMMYVRKGRHFMSFTMTELHDVAASMGEMLQKMEECKDVLSGKIPYIPKTRKESTRALKSSRRSIQLEREETRAFQEAWNQTRNMHQTPEEPDEEEDEDKDEEENEALATHTRSSRGSKRK